MVSGIFLGGAADGLQSGSKAAIEIMNEKRNAEQQQRAELSKLVEANMAQIQSIFKETAAAGGDVSKLADNPAVQAHLQYVNKFATQLGQDPGIYDARVRTMALAKPAEDDKKHSVVQIGENTNGLTSTKKYGILEQNGGTITPIGPDGQPVTASVTAQPQLGPSDVIPPAQAQRANPVAPPGAPAPQAAAPVPQGNPMDAMAQADFGDRFQEPPPSAPPENLNVNSEALTGLSPGAAGLVKGVADGTVDPTKAFSLRKGPNGQSERAAVLEKVKQYDPSFDMTNYAGRAATLKAFKSGVEARKLTALGTVVGHVGELYKDGQALDNWKSDTFGAATKTANELRQWVQSNKQSPIIRRFELSATAVSNELENAFRGNSTAVSGIQEWRKSINPSMASDEIAQSTQKLGSLLSARMSEMKEQWDRGMGHNQDPSISLKLSATRDLIEKMAAGTLFSDKVVNGTAPKTTPNGIKWSVQ